MYSIGENVIIKYYDSNQVGQVVDMHRNRNTGDTYDVMSEKGTMYSYSAVDKPKLNQYIDSVLTNKLIGSGEITTNLKVGWIGNYADGTQPSAFWLNDDTPNLFNNMTTMLDDEGTEKSPA